ncbi:MAG: hypothetical protein P4M12_05660 [Gammaproteobacteria bacterium]|nr:hypothetical protein [Gammaproteobacteria bacterium]
MGDSRATNDALTKAQRALADYVSATKECITKGIDDKTVQYFKSIGQTNQDVLLRDNEELKKDAFNQALVGLPQNEVQAMQARYKAQVALAEYLSATQEKDKSLSSGLAEAMMRERYGDNHNQPKSAYTIAQEKEKQKERAFNEAVAQLPQEEAPAMKQRYVTEIEAINKAQSDALKAKVDAEMAKKLEALDPYLDRYVDASISFLEAKKKNNNYDATFDALQKYDAARMELDKKVYVHDYTLHSKLKDKYKEKIEARTKADQSLPVHFVLDERFSKLDPSVIANVEFNPDPQNYTPPKPVSPAGAAPLGAGVSQLTAATAPGVDVAVRQSAEANAKQKQDIHKLRKEVVALHTAIRHRTLKDTGREPVINFKEGTDFKKGKAVGKLGDLRQGENNTTAPIYDRIERLLQDQMKDVSSFDPAKFDQEVKQAAAELKTLGVANADKFAEGCKKVVEKDLETIKNALERKRINEHYANMNRDLGFVTQWRKMGQAPEEVPGNTMAGNLGNGDYTKLGPGIYEAVTNAKYGEAREKGYLVKNQDAIAHSNRYNISLDEQGVARPVPPPTNPTEFGKAQSDAMDFLLQNGSTNLTITHNNPTGNDGYYLKEGGYFDNHFDAMLTKKSARIDVDEKIMHELSIRRPDKFKDVKDKITKHNAKYDKSKQAEVDFAEKVDAAKNDTSRKLSTADKAKSDLAKVSFKADMGLAKAVDERRINEGVMTQVSDYVAKEMREGRKPTNESIKAKIASHYTGAEKNTNLASHEMAENRAKFEEKPWVQGAAKLGALQVEAILYVNQQDLLKEPITEKKLTAHLVESLGDVLGKDGHKDARKAAEYFMSQLELAQKNQLAAAKSPEAAPTHGVAGGIKEAKPVAPTGAADAPSLSSLTVERDTAQPSAGGEKPGQDPAVLGSLITEKEISVEEAAELKALEQSVKVANQQVAGAQRSYDTLAALAKSPDQTAGGAKELATEIRSAQSKFDEAQAALKAAQAAYTEAAGKATVPVRYVKDEFGIPQIAVHRQSEEAKREEVHKWEKWGESNSAGLALLAEKLAAAEAQAAAPESKEGSPDEKLVGYFSNEAGKQDLSLEQRLEKLQDAYNMLKDDESYAAIPIGDRTDLFSNIEAEVRAVENKININNRKGSGNEDHNSAIASLSVDIEKSIKAREEEVVPKPRQSS